MRFAGVILAWVVAMPGPAHGAEAPVHRCRGSDGSVHFQDRACPAGRADPAWDAEDLAARATEPSDPAAVAARSRQAALELREQRRWEKASRAGLPPSLGGAAPRAAGAARQGANRAGRDESAGGACRQAMASRDEAYSRDWMRLDFEQRGRLDAAVRSACGAADR